MLNTNGLKVSNEKNSKIEFFLKTSLLARNIGTVSSALRMPFFHLIVTENEKTLLFIGHWTDSVF